MIDRSLSDPDLTGTIRVVSAAATHVGHVRATNEDSILNAPPIYLVADGMGGHNAGEVDDAAIEKLLRSPSDVRTLSQDLVGRALDGGGHDNISVVLVEAVEVVGQSRIAEDTASRDGAEPQDDGFEIDEDTLPRGLRDGGDERR